MSNIIVLLSKWQINCYVETACTLMIGVLLNVSSLNVSIAHGVTDDVARTLDTQKNEILDCACLTSIHKCFSFRLRPAL